MTKFLTLSIFILLSHQVLCIQQSKTCLGISNSSEYNFALAKLQSPKQSPQEACNSSCGADLVTYSTNKMDVPYHMPIANKKIRQLTWIGFLESGQTYLLVGYKDGQGFEHLQIFAYRIVQGRKTRTKVNSRLFVCIYCVFNWFL